MLHKQKATLLITFLAGLVAAMAIIWQLSLVKNALFLLAVWIVSLIFGTDLLYLLLKTFNPPWAQNVLKKLVLWQSYRGPFIGPLMLGFLVKSEDLPLHTTYFSVVPFTARQVLYIVIILYLPSLIRRLNKSLSLFAGFLGLLLISSLFFVDWGMLLFSPWHSTMFPLLMSALSMTAVIGGVLWQRGHKAYQRHEIYDVGRLGITALIFTLYLHYSQFLISWQARLPIEMEWFRERSVGFLGVLAICLFLAKYVFPLTILFLRNRLEKWRPLRMAGVLIFLLFPFELFWIFSQIS